MAVRECGCVGVPGDAGGGPGLPVPCGGDGVRDEWGGGEVPGAMRFPAAGVVPVGASCHGDARSVMRVLSELPLGARGRGVAIDAVSGS